MTEPQTCSTCPVLGTHLAIIDYANAANLVHRWATSPVKTVKTVAASNTHVVALARHDPSFRKAIDTIDLNVPDGMPIIWSMNRQGAGLKDRVYGPTLMLHVLAKPGLSHFFMGGSDELLADLSAKLRERFPEIAIAGSYSPPFGDWPEEEQERIFKKIADSGATCIWIGLGCPKQERWLAKHKSRLPPGVYLAVGAAFAFHAKRVKQAPPWMQKRGLEWLFRLLAEPRRLFKRYATYNSLFLWYSITDR